MKQINKFLIEKLILGKDISTPKKQQLTPIEPRVQRKIEDLMWEKSPGASSRHKDKMIGYQNKGSDPKRLIATIKNNTKLINRWWAAITLQWNEAIKLFGEAIAARTDITLENLHQYVIKTLSRSNALSEAYNNYMKLYNIVNETN